MKQLVFALSAFSALTFSSCCGCDGKNEEHANHHDSTHHADEHHEEESTLAFDGVDKGDFVLYGHSDMDANGAATIDEMYAEMESTGKFERKVKVNIAEVCQKAGCWITFNNTSGESVRVFFRDHFTIPIETPAGTEAILYGALVMDTLSVDFQKHLLDDAKDAGEEVTQAEYDAIKKDKIEATFDCESILVKKK